uniref:HECT-type E3 ubiquitin transferase n=1 Tax=Schistosoma mansoni TaxID=6183 RepID=A0A3Q0KSC8_SCHMA
MLLAKHLSVCPDEQLISELKRIKVWNYGKCELGLWADVLDRLDAILENAVTKVGKWMLRLDAPGNSSLVDDVVTILEFTGHLIEHSIYRYLYGSWTHILALFGSSNLDVLLAVLGLSYNFSKRSNYFIRLDPTNKQMILDRLVSIAETWGGAENGFGLAACCDPNHFPETAGNVYFEYRSEQPPGPSSVSQHSSSSEQLGSSSSSGTIVLQALHRRNQIPSEIMEELLAVHPVPVSQQMALFSRVRLATYFADPTQRHKCIRARLQALSILSYTFDVDERHLYPSLIDELVEVLGLSDDQYMGIKACALRTMTAIVNSHRLGINWGSLVGSTGLSSYHGILPNLTRKWIKGLVDGSIKASAGSTNQHFTTALLSFLYHLACYEENVGPDLGNIQNTTLSSSGILDTMTQLISWHTPHNDYLSYVTRAVRVTDQILLSISSSRQHVVSILVDRLNYEVEVVLQSSTSSNKSSVSDYEQTLNTQRSGLMKSILNLLKRLCLDAEWGDIVHSVMDGNLPSVLRQIFLNGSTHFTPHLSLFAMETITNYLYTYPSRISTMQDKNITSDILKALTEQPLPQNRDFLVQLPALLNTLALNSRGIEAILSSGVINRYLNTLVSPDYLTTMKTKRVREFISQISYDMNCNSGQNLSNSLTASQMSNAIQELLRSHTELKPVVFKCVISCLRHVVSLGKTPATLPSESVSCNPAVFNILSRSTRNPNNFGLRSFAEVAGEPPIHQTQGSSDGISQTVTSAPLGLSNIQNAIGATEDDVVMSGGEDDDDYSSDIDVNQDSQQAHSRSETVQAGTIVSGASISMASLEYSLECDKMSVTNDANTARTEAGSVTPNVFLPDFMLNMCKFLEKLLPFGSHTTEAMCPQFVSQGGLQALCDLIRMPGLPYDFPVSATCASLCKIFEDLANSVNLTDVTKPLFQCLESSLDKLSVLHTSNYPMSSILLREYLSGEREVLHELVTIASVVCILVQMIEHIKSEIRLSLASSWLSQNCLKTLGRLYLGVSWEAGILLKVLFGDKDINESDMLNGLKIPQHLLNSSSKSGDSNSTVPNKVMNIPSEPMPQFVEALHMYSLITQSISPTTDGQSFISKHSELVKPLNRILHVTAFLINSVTELFIALGRFFSNRTQINYRRRRTTLIPNDLIPNEMRSRALAQVADVLSITYTWEPASTNRNHKATASLNYAIRYASIRLTNLLLHDSVQRNSDLGMINAFFRLNGITLYFGLFRQLISFDLDDPAIRKPLSIVLEEWLVCADRMSNASFCAPSHSDTNRTTDTEANAMNVKKITARVHQCMIPALAQLCSRTDLQDLLSRKAVEHLLSMLVTIVPYIFNSDNKQRLIKSEESANAIHSSGWDKTLDGRPNNLPSTDNLIEINPSTHQPSMLQEAPNIFISSSNRLSEPQIASTESPLEGTDISSQTLSTAVTQDPSATPLLVDQTMSQSNAIDNAPFNIYFDVDTVPPDNVIRDQEALRLMEEMGFARDLAIVALEQTGWNANEAVNLVIATSPHDLLQNANPSFISGLRRGRTSRRAQRRRTLGAGNVANESSPLLTNVDNSQFQTDVYEHVTEFIDNFSTAEQIESQINPECPTLSDNEIPSSLGDKDTPTIKRTNVSKFPLVMMELCNEKTYNEACASLKQNVFKTCYAIAKHHQSYQILHQIAELFISSGEHEQYINELFGVVTSHLKSYFSVSPNKTLNKSDNENYEFTNYEKEHQTVGLHLIALLFTRSPLVCACLAWSHKLPSVLIQFVSDSDILNKSVTTTTTTTNSSSGGVTLREDTRMEVDEFSTDVSYNSNAISKSDYYKTLTLAFLVLDQYERSIQALRLRQECVKLYASSHNWHWFDNQAMLWHPYTNESIRIIDKSFHKGDLCAFCDINRRPYTVEFPTMTQINLVSMHRRPVMLFPSISENIETDEASSIQTTPYELSLMNTKIPECLNAEERSKLCHALLTHFRTFKNLSSEQQSHSTLSMSENQHSDDQLPLPSDCLNAMFRLMLRLCFTSYEDADKLAEADLLTTLFSYPHAPEFSPEFSSFVGALISETFDDTSTIDRIMKEICIRMSRSGMPNVFMGIDAGPRTCRDLFYLLSLCAPLLAKDRERALRLATETFSLSLPDSDIEGKVYPKTYIVEESNPPGAAVSDRSSVISFPLTPHQKHLLTQLMDLIMCSTWKSKGNHTFTGLQHIEVTEAPGNDGFTSESAHPPISNTRTVTSRSGATTAQSANTCTRPDQSSLENSTIRLTHSEFNKQNGFVVLGKSDAMQYLIDLVGTYKSVAEFVAMYKHKHSVEHTSGKSNADVSRCSFISYLFSHQLNNSETAESTMSLLKNLILISSESIQGVIINEFKASLGRVATKHYPISLEDNKSEIISPMKNDRIASHMMFLMRILSLPSPLINRVLRLLYKRRIPADIARLIAIVDCNLPNTQFTINIMLHALESLTLVDRQYTKFNSQGKRLANNSTGRQVNAASASNEESGDVEMRLTSTIQTSTITDSTSQDPILHTIPSSEQRTDVSLDRGTTNISSTIPGSDHTINTSRDFETDSDDDDDDDVTMSDQQEFSHPVQNVDSAFDRPSLILSSTAQGSASSSLNRVLNDVLTVQADMVISSDHNENVHQPWRSVGNGDQETRSVIFVYDDEDEGSSGQGAEGNNSQEEEEEDDVLGEDEDEEEEEEDDDDDEDDDDQDDEDGENDPDVEGDDGDVDVSGEDEEVAFVLSRSRRHENRTRPSGLSSPRRRRPNASISVTVTTNRTNSDRNQNTESHDDGENLHNEDTDIVLHDDTHVEDDGSFGDDDLDTYGRDDDDTPRDDVAIISSDIPGVIFPNENRGSHGNHSVAAVVEETLRRVVAPPLNVISSNGFRDLGTNSLSTLNVHSRGSSTGNWDYLLPAFTNLIARHGSRHIPFDGESNLPTSTTIFRFGPEASVFVGGSNSTRLGSGVNFVYSSNNQTGLNTSQSIQAVPAATLANQHPLLQVPMTTGTNVGLSTNNTNTGTSSHNTSTNNVSGLRVFGVLPRPQHVPPHYGTRHRITGSSGPHLSSGLTGLRHHTSFSRLFNAESEPDGVSSGGSNSLNRSQLATDVSGLGLSRPIIADAVSMSPVNRVFYVPPTIPQQQFPPSYGSRHRFPGTTASHLPSSSGSCSRHQTSFNRSFNAESQPNANSESSSSHLCSQITANAQDNRSGPEADALVWTMLTSLAEDQPSPVNSALSAAIFSRFFSQGQTSRNQQGIMDIRSRGLTPYAGYALPPHYRRWTNLSRMLFGHEVMDLILLARHHIYKALEQKRHELYSLRISENEILSLPVVTSSPDEPLVAAPTLTSTNNNANESAETFVTFATPLVTCVSTSENSGYTQESSVDLQQQLPVVSIDSAATFNQINPDVCVNEASEISISSDVSMSNPAILPVQNEPEPTNPIENISNLVTSSNDTPTTNTSTGPPTRSLVMTDEETIQSLVEGGMDPSFLDALPEEMRQEVIADHRYARQVQQRINSMSLPVHVNSEWLTGLPPHIQEEVLAQFRQEQQQQSSTQPSTTTSGEINTTEQSTAQPPSTQNTTDSNTAFLVSLPPSVLREVLADMEESQLETLPQYLVVEANRLRREHEERYARAVQNGIFAHSNDSRPYHFWRNFTTTSGLLGGGGQGRWIVRFHSNDQIVVHPNNIDGSLSLNNALGVRTMAGLSSRELIDHEGLTCIIVLLIASSSCSNQRQNIVPTVKKVLRNLSCHSATRNWIVNTIISLFNGLSEKPPAHLQSTSSFVPSIEECEPIPSTSHDRGVSLPASESEFQCSTKPMSNNTLFHTGFEAALGCWVRIFHPVPQNLSHTPYLQNDSHTVVPTYSKDTSSSTPVRYIIHPQGAVFVAGILLETLNELTRAFPSHFYPSEACQSESAGTSHSTDIPFTSFWDIFNRLSQSNITSLPVGPTTRPVVKRARISSRKRPVSISDKQQASDSTQESSASTPKTSINPCHKSSNLTTTETLSSSSYSADVLENDSMKEVTNETQYSNNNSSKSITTTNTTPVTVNCFTALSELLCHQLLHDRPNHQERLITILAGIVKDFLLSRSHSNISVAQASTHPTNLVTPTTVNTILTDTNQQNPTDMSSQQSTTDIQSSHDTESVPTSIPEDQSSQPPVSNSSNILMSPLRPQVIETLCQLVLAPKFSETARIMTTQLITDLAQANPIMKESILRLLSITAGQLITTISDQLQCLVSEVDKRLKGKALDSLPTYDQSKPSSSRYPSEISRISSYDVLPDRFGIPGQMVVVSSDSRFQSATKFSDLQLNSSEVFTCPNNDQCRLRGILGLMLRIAAGDSSLVGSNPIPVSSDDLLISVPGVNEFWDHLCQAFEKLQALNDQNAVLLLQPLLEVFCLAHVHLVKETILLRQRSTNSRSSRTNSCSSGTLSLIDMVPLLHMCIDSTSHSELDTNRSSTTDHLSHLYFDLGGPQSPDVTTAGEDLTVTACTSTNSATASQSPFSKNPIIEFADKYRRGLSQVLRHHGANIGESPFAVFLAYPRVLDFDVKRRFFRQQLQSLSNRSTSSNRYDDDPITVSRDRIFEDSYARLHRRSVSEWKHKFVIRFQNEEGQDAGGPLREWFLLMSREIFNPNYCLFRVSPADRVTYTINPSSYINSNHLSYFKFVGRFIAKAINDNKLLECYFTRAFYKHILGVPVRCSDLESEDYEFFKGLEFLLSHDVSDLGYELTFSTEINEFGKTDTRDLIENGRNVAVTENNKKEYVRLVCQERMTGAIRQQLDAFLRGFYDIIPKRMISIFNEQELELLISGLPNIDLVDLKANTTYSKYQPNSPQIEWFWQALESFDQEDLARFLQFVTGTSKVPLGGFMNLEGMHGPTKFQISRASVSSTNHLPSAHTCFNTLVLPAYESYEQLRSRLLMAIRECSEGYGMA